MGSFIKFTAKVVSFVAWCCIGYGCDDSEEYKDEIKKTRRNENESASTSTTSSSECNSENCEKDYRFCRTTNAYNQGLKLLKWNDSEEEMGSIENDAEEEVVVLDISTNSKERFEANYYENIITYCGTIPSEDCDTETRSNKRRRWRPRKTMDRVFESLNVVGRMKERRERSRRYKARFGSEVCS